MSWFSDIAGKAEDLLNRVDQSAATALQNKSKPTSSQVPKSQHIEGTVKTHYNANSVYGSASSTSVSSRMNTSNTKRSYSPGTLTPKKKTESDDEQLFKFLNCEDSLPTPPRKSQSHSNVSVNKTENNGTNSDIGSSVKDSQVPIKMENKEYVRIDIGDASGDKDDPPANAKFNSSSPIQNSETENNENKLTEFDDSLNTPAIVPDSLQAVDVTVGQLNTIVVNEELSLANKRAQHAEAEMKRMQKKLDHWNSQISGNDKLVRELKDREMDMGAAMDAKDSQLAILKVRLEEADQDRQSKRTMIEELKDENQRIIKDHADGAIFQNNTVESMRDHLQKSEAELNKTREALRQFQVEHMQSMGKMEEEQRHLAESYSALQKKWSESNERNKDIALQLKNVTTGSDALQQEYTDYKQKAQRILQSKEKLITSLKEGNFDADSIEKTEASSALLSAEVEGIKQERDLLREELRRANELVETYRAENQELEKISRNDSNTSQDRARILEQQLVMEKMQKEESQLLSNQLKEELQFLREDLTRTKGNLQSRIQDREIEIEKLRRQLTAKSLSTVSQDELESRLHALTENLIQKQTLVEALSTEKNSLVLQLERLEQRMKESQTFGSQHHTFVGVNNNEPERKAKSVFLDNPFDSPLTRKVKRVYGGIDAFSVRLGRFFRSYPIARVFVIVYMLLLHFWVMIVLLTYEPEVHNSTYENLKKV